MRGQVSAAMLAVAAAMALPSVAGEAGVKVPPPPPQPNPVRRAPVTQAPVAPPELDPPMPSDAECAALPQVRPPFAFSPGEVLEYDLDALGMLAGKLTIGVRPLEGGSLPIRVDASTNTLFSKIRKVTGGATAWLNPKTLRPVKYLEDATENGVRKMSMGQFRSGEHLVDMEWAYGPRSGKSTLRYGNDGLDVAGAIFLMRTLPWKAGAKTCVDIFAIRRIWRLVGKVEAREHVSLPLGEFEAWHFSGVAIRTDDQRARREVHVWLSDDARRLPLVVVGAIDLGAVRATLNAVTRPGEKPLRGEDPKQRLKW